MSTLKPEGWSIQAVKPKGLKVLSPVIPLIRVGDLVNSRGSQQERMRPRQVSVHTLGVEVHGMDTKALFRNLGDLVCFSKVENRLNQAVELQGRGE